MLLKAYKSKISQRLQCLLMFILFLSFGLIGVYLFWDAYRKHGDSAQYVLPVLSIFLFTACSIGCLFCYAAMLTEYKLTDHEIERRSLFGIRSMSWRDIVSVDEIDGIMGGTCIITAQGGLKLKVRFSYLDQTASELHSELFKHLGALRIKQLHGVSSSNFRIGGDTVWKTILSCLMGVTIVAVGIYISQATHTLPFRIFTMSVFTVLGMLFILLSIYSASRRIILTPDMISYSSLFGSSCFPLKTIESVYIHGGSTIPGFSEILVLKYNNKVIRLSSSIQKYPFLKTAILQNVDPSAKERGKEELEDILGQRKRQMKNISSKVAAILAFGMLLQIACQGYITWERIEPIDRLQQSGRRAKAEVVAIRGGTSDSAWSDIKYSFVVNDKRFFGENNANTGRANRLKIGDSIAIRYLPVDPHANRLEAKMDYKWELISSLVGNLFVTSLFLALIIALIRHDKLQQ